MDWKAEYKEKICTFEEAASVVKSGDRIPVGAISGVPVEIINAITKREDLEDIMFLSGLWVGLPNFIGQDLGLRFKYSSIFMGPLERMMMEKGIVEPVSIHFSQGAAFIANTSIDVSVLEVSPPDDKGRMSVGPGSSLLGAGLFKKASKLLVQVNPNVPNICGSDVHIHVSEVDCICEVNRPMPDVPSFEPDETEKKIAAIIVDEIGDGTTLQLGIGKLANAIGSELKVKKDIGIHSELLTPSMIELMKNGVITGKKKNYNPDKVIVAFGIGSAEDNAFIHENETVEFHPTSYVNDPNIIGKNNNFVSINNAIAVDLSGQVSSESLGARQYSATGGQVDFVRGAGISKGGRSFIALKSTADTSNGIKSRISAIFKPGTIITTPRSDVQFVVTEYGIANLKFKTIPSKVNEMLKIAHPDFREDLARKAVDTKLIHPSQVKI